MSVHVPEAGSDSSENARNWRSGNVPDTKATSGENLAIGQESGGVILAAGNKIARVRPCARRRIVELRFAQNTLGIVNAPATRTLPLGSSVAV